MIIKDCYKDLFYKFNSNDLSLTKTEEREKTSGHLFIINSNSYILYSKAKENILISKEFKLKIEDFSFEYN